ncbi:heavy-metal-associated domain-containing protein [Paucibacter sp. B2R-40]|uniref:heavy-metal-associated domain-containing protein n=1 Tax=Paucibacter sp. B2R-40 TaxID=2893554 RepID=UPI0021E485E8|nr:heavy metal-associated domain-containing protein [Paucibacter sp. B2R-40]MCV2352837.1 heavy-metal-associated domain-containing protein [Paucibacter sp. B2R-40]
MPETIFEIPALQSQDDADAVMFELQDLPCVNQADVDLGKRQAWVNHTAMISAEDIAAALAEAGYESRVKISEA